MLGGGAISIKATPFHCGARETSWPDMDVGPGRAYA